MPSVLGCVGHVVILNLMFVIGDIAVFQGMNGGDPKVPFDLAIGFLAPLSVTAILTLLVVALSWVSLASNAKTFRKTSPASAQRKAKVFVGVMAGCVSRSIRVDVVGERTKGMMPQTATHTIRHTFCGLQ